MTSQQKEGRRWSAAEVTTTENAMYSIEKNVPIPPVTPRNARYPFKLLEIGDSFAVPLGGENAARVVNRMKSNATNYRTIGKFTVMLTGDKVRVWRAA